MNIDTVRNMPTRICRKCGLPIVWIDGVWTVMDTETTADGLSYCPPDPDTRKRPGDHIPRKSGRSAAETPGTIANVQAFGWGG